MENYKFKNKEIEFWKISGEVISSEKRAELSIHANIHSRGGNLNSSNIIKHEFWVKTDGGVEAAVNLSGIDFPLRESQKVTVLFAGLKTAKLGWPIFIANHTTQRRRFILHSLDIMKKFDIHGWSFKSLFLSILIFGIIYYISPGNPIAYWAAGIFFSYRFVNHVITAQKILKTISSHVDSIANSIQPVR